MAAQPLVAEDSALDRFVWPLVEQSAPDLAPILRHGVVGWLTDGITSALTTLVNTLAAPVLALVGVQGTLTAHFAKLVDWTRDAAAKLARGDCSSVVEAAEKIQQLAEAIGSAVTHKWQDLSAKVGAFVNRLWERTGAPIWEFLKEVGGSVWERIQGFGLSVWEKTAPFREKVLVLGTRAWNWIKNKLGIGATEDGRNGLLQWVQRKAAEAWALLKPRIEPIKKPLLVVAGVLAFAAGGPVLWLGAGVVGLIAGIRWVRQHLRSPEGVVEQRGVLQRTIIPGILHGVRTITAAVSSAATLIRARLGEALAGLTQLVTAVGGSLLRFATSAVQWMCDQFAILVRWTNDQLAPLATWVRNALDRLRTYFEPMIDFLRDVGAAIADLMRMPAIVVSGIWKAIPDCVKEPVKNFLINQILKRIALFKQIAELPNVWAKIKATVMELFQKIFRDGDLAGAALIVLKLALNALGLPLELVLGVFDKAGAAVDTIIEDPQRFLSNLLAAAWQGFTDFFGSIGSHLLRGVLDWLLGAVADAGIRLPTELSLRGVLPFVLDLLGITAERIFQRLAAKIGQPLMDKIRRAVDVLTDAWDWVSALMNEGLAGLWTRLSAQLANLWDAVLNSAVGWLVTNVTGAAAKKILPMLAGGPIGVVITGLISFFKAIQSAARYARQIVQIVDSLLDTVGDIAHGALGKAAGLLVSNLARGIPVVIGFLANQLGLGDLSTRIRDVVDGIRTKVESAIDWLIDQAIKLGQAVLGAIGRGPEEAKDPQATAVKVKALAEVETRIRQKPLASFDQLHDVLATVLDTLRPEGLKSLWAQVTDEETQTITLSVSASKPQTLFLKVTDVFAGATLTPGMRSRLQEHFRYQGFETNAWLVVNGTRTAMVQNNSKGHAEAVLVESKEWKDALSLAAERSSHGVLTDISILINRTPCSDCADVLSEEIAKVAPQTRQYTLFRLAPTGTYEPTVEQTEQELNAIAERLVHEWGITLQIALERLGGPERVYAANVTKITDLQKLMTAGWDLRVLSVSADPSARAKQLDMAVERLIAHAVEKDLADKAHV